MTFSNEPITNIHNTYVELKELLVSRLLKVPRTLFNYAVLEKEIEGENPERVINYLSVVIGMIEYQMEHLQAFKENPNTLTRDNLVNSIELLQPTNSLDFFKVLDNTTIAKYVKLATKLDTLASSLPEVEEPSAEYMAKRFEEITGCKVEILNLEQFGEIIKKKREEAEAEAVDESEIPDLVSSDDESDSDESPDVRECIIKSFQEFIRRRNEQRDKESTDKSNESSDKSTGEPSKQSTDKPTDKSAGKPTDKSTNKEELLNFLDEVGTKVQIMRVYDISRHEITRAGMKVLDQIEHHVDVIRSSVEVSQAIPSGILEQTKKLFVKLFESVERERID